MWWAGSERLEVYLGNQVAGRAPLVAASGVPVQWVQAESPAIALEQALLPSSGEGKREGGLVLAVRLSGALARPFLFEAVEGLKYWKEAIEVAAAVAPEVTGLNGPCSVWLDDWMPGKACVAVAIDTALRDEIQSIARRRKMRIGVLQPWWKTAIDAAAAQVKEPPQLLAVLDTDSLTVITSNLSSYVGLATYAPKPANQQSRGVVTRAAMTANLLLRDVAWASLDTLGPSLAPVVERWT